MARKAAKADAPKRKIGERVETIDVKLTQVQIEDLRAKVIEMFDERDELEERLRSIKADYKAKIAELDSKRTESLGAIRSGKIRREVTIEEWVTDRNEVIRIDAATREELGRRNATARELQEELPLDEAPAKAPAKAASDDEGDDDAEDTEAAVDRENEEDFGGGSPT